MTTRNRVFQPTTKALGDLAIGIMKSSVGAAVDGNKAADAPDLASLGALKDSTLAMKPTFKDHTAGYPQSLDFKICELLAANWKVGVEEIGSAIALQLIDDCLDTLETGTNHFRCIEGLSEFANGGTLSLFSPNCQLKPTLNMNFGDDFSVLPFEFESLVNPAFTNQELIYRTRAAAGARSIANQPMTNDVNNLGIGMFQVRVGKPSKRAAGAAYIYPSVGLRQHGGAPAANTPIGAATGAYIGAKDGAFVLTCTDNTADSVNFTVTDPMGDALAPVEFINDAPTLVGSGVSVAFPAAAITGGPTHFAVGDVFTIGVVAGAQMDNDCSNIISPYSFLTSADSIGSIKSATLATNPTFKDHFSGYPKVRDMLMLEKSTVEISTALEEISAGMAALVQGRATTPWDMLFDASVNGTLYYVPVELVMNLATGGVMSFWFPNCLVTPEADYAPGNDWASMPFKLEALIQSAGSTTKRIYRGKHVPLI